MRLIITLLSHRVGSLIMWLFCHLEGTLLKWVQLRGSGGPVLLPRGNNYLGNWHSQKRAISTDRRISLSSCLIRSNRDFWSLTGLKNNNLKIKQGENAFPCKVITQKDSIQFSQESWLQTTLQTFIRGPKRSNQANGIPVGPVDHEITTQGTRTPQSARIDGWLADFFAIARRTSRIN